MLQLQLYTKSNVNINIHCVLKNRTPKTGWYNFIKIGPLRIIFSEDALAFICELTAFEKLHMGWVSTAQFPWQQQHRAWSQYVTWTEAASG